MSLLAVKRMEVIYSNKHASTGEATSSKDTEEQRGFKAMRAQLLVFDQLISYCVYRDRSNGKMTGSLTKKNGMWKYKPGMKIQTTQQIKTETTKQTGAWRRCEQKMWEKQNLCIKFWTKTRHTSNFFQHYMWGKKKNNNR